MGPPLDKESKNVVRVIGIPIPNARRLILGYEVSVTLNMLHSLLRLPVYRKLE